MMHKPFLSSMHSPWHPEWDRRVEALNRHEVSRRRLIWRLVREAPRHRVVVVLGMIGLRDGYVDLLAAALIARRSRPVVVTECGWEPGSRALARVLRRRAVLACDPLPVGGAAAARTIIHALDGERIHYCVLSEYDRGKFPDAWRIPANRVHLTPFCYTIDDVDAPVTREGPVFAGGNSSRDYRALLQAAHAMEAPITIATTLPLGPVPPNVRAGPIPHADYQRLLRGARAVVVPLLAETARSAGQTTYLNAMVLGKPLIVTDSPGVRDYVQDGVTGLVVPPDDAQALRAALDWVLDRSNEAAVHRMCAQARRVTLERYSPSAYLDSILGVAERAADQPAQERT